MLVSAWSNNESTKSSVVKRLQQLLMYIAMFYAKERCGIDSLLVLVEVLHKAVVRRILCFWRKKKGKKEIQKEGNARCQHETKFFEKHSFPFCLFLESVNS